MAKKLAIDYNRSIPIGAVHDDPLTFLLLDKLFDDVKIFTSSHQQWLSDLDLQAEPVSLNIPASKLRNGDAMLRSKRFNDYAKADPKRKYVLYSPLDPPYKINPLAFLMNSPTIAHAYENKRYFRDEFADLIRMPEYEIKYMNELDRAASYRDLRDQFGEFVLQDEESHGSKGTYMIRNHDDYADAVKSLKKFSQGRSIVVSKLVEGETCSIQVCITKHGIFSAGVQKQLVDSKFLCNPKVQGGTRWCGGELGGDYPDIVQHQAHEMATIVGSELASHGYKGIFGVDIIVTPENEVYAIEINARLTGYSHLVSDMQLQQGKIPFMLLHILELGNFKYEVTDYDALPSISRYKRPVSYMILNNTLDEDFTLPQYIKPGVYQYKDGSLTFVKPGHSLHDLKGEDTLLLSCKYHPGDQIGFGKRILKITRLGKSMVKGDLNLKNQQLVAAVKKTFKLPA